MAVDAAVSGDGVARSRILSELEAIFQSAEFERAPVMRRLLAFLVRTTLAGGGDELKAYVVAVDGLGRDPDFDAQSDSYPRVQVGRLRKMLDAYYAQTPPADGVRLFIKPGGYRVDFSQSDGDVTARPVATAEDASLPTPLGFADIGAVQSRLLREAMRGRALVTGVIALALIATIALAWWLGAGTARPPRQAPVMEIRRIAAVGSPEADALARRVEALLGIALHRSWIVRVTTPEAARAGIAKDSIPPSYRLAGQVSAGPGYAGRRLFLTLWDLDQGEQIWSDTVELPADDSSIFETTRPLISSLIRPFGVIATDQRAKTRADDRSTYACLLDYDRYFRDRDPAISARVRSCMAEALKREPMNATVLAAASFLEFDFSLNRGSAESHARGTDLARRAVAADPYSAEAQVADARAAFIAGQCQRGKDIADRAVRLNPFNPDHLGLLGFLLYMCDEPGAEPLLETARTLDAEIPPFYTVAQLLALIEQGRVADAIRIADTIRAPGAGMLGQYELVRAIAASARGDMPAARRHWQRILAASKVKSSDPDKVLAQYFYSPRFRAKVVRYLATHGVTPAA